MRKKSLIIICSILALTLISGVLFVSISRAGDVTDITQVNSVTSGAIIPGGSEIDKPDDTYNPPIFVDNPSISPSAVPTPTEEPEEPFVPDFTMDLEPSSITVYVNKEYALPKKYVPEELVTPNVFFNLIYYDQRTLMRPEAAQALEKLFAAGEREGYFFTAVSGYRSYDRQRNIFKNNIATKGKDYTLQYSAVPGTSEHQTGLAIDVSTESLKHLLSTRFAETPEGVWLADNAHRFGYIIRYPKGKAKVTGYAYEPWHIRYVGKGLAKYLYENELTLDEYYNYTPSEGFDFEALYADLINYVPEVTNIPIEGDDVIIGENGEIIDGDLGEEVNPDEEDTAPDGTDDETDAGKEDDNSEEEPSGEDIPPGKDEGNATEEEPGETDEDSDSSNDSDSEENPDTQNPVSPTPTVTPAITPTPTPSITPSITPVATPMPTPTLIPTPTDIITQ